MERSPTRRDAPFQLINRVQEKGQSILEMAVVLPILALLLASVIDAARAFDAYIVLTNAVREGARSGSADASLGTAAIQNIVVADIQGSGTNLTRMSDLTVDHVTVEGLGSTTAVTVTVEYDLDLWFGGLIGLEDFHLRKQAVMPVFTGSISP